jgi:hypothetical protein
LVAHNDFGCAQPLDRLFYTKQCVTCANSRSTLFFVHVPLVRRWKSVSGKVKAHTLANSSPRLDRTTKNCANRTHLSLSGKPSHSHLPLQLQRSAYKRVNVDAHFYFNHHQRLLRKIDCALLWKFL